MVLIVMEAMIKGSPAPIKEHEKRGQAASTELSSSRAAD